MISICEWIFGARPLTEVTELLVRSGYDAIEVMGEPQRSDRERLRKELRARDLSASGTTAICNWPTDERDLASPHADVRRAAVGYFRGCIDLAVDVGADVVGLIPAAVGRLDALSSYREEWAHAVAGTREVAFYAGERGVAVGVEAINRYETFLVNRVDQALAFVDEVGVSTTGVIADAFHMQLEEPNSAAAVRAAGERLLALHLADSNRLGLGRGQLRLEPVFEAAASIGFAGPFVLEFTAPGPNPFEPNKAPEAMALLEEYVPESAAAARRLIPPVTTT